MDGFLLIDRQDLACTEREMLMMATIEPLLRKLCLSLYCPRCHAMGNKDGIECKNHPTDATWTIACGCTVRTWRRSAPPPTLAH